ncbi:tyrosine-protein phosphatase [Polymorphospora lycopeni]|uniref:Tyrosine-protein phosphatase n=1 Tax=Polymorphospora lycopeni TaxID=3140240 RepID=A0ABV5D0H6_9ACTN
MDWSEFINFRDLGGLPTVDGGEIQAGALLRSGCHNQLPPAAIRAIRGSRMVSRIVDLRWAKECRTHPSPFAEDEIYRHMPLLNDVLTYTPPPDSYGPMLDHNQERIGAAFRAVAEAPPGGVLVHCRAGKDRTGVLVALLLTAAGVDAAVTARDYARSDSSLEGTMRETLAHLDRRYGGIADYLATVGVGSETLAAARNRLLR